MNQETWEKIEKEFDEKWLDDLFTEESIKSFLRQILEQRDKEILKEIEKWAEKESEREDINTDDYDVITLWRLQEKLKELCPEKLAENSKKK